MEQGVKQNIKENKTYYLTMTVVNWIDVFTRKNHCDAIIESLKYCQKPAPLDLYCAAATKLILRLNPI
jgi:putative transposase